MRVISPRHQRRVLPVELAFQRVAEWFPTRWPDPCLPTAVAPHMRVHDAELAEHELIALAATPIPGKRELGFRVFTVTHKAPSRW